ncbi:MAG: DUF3810 domain-containing protein [Thermoanaerobacteraceae bacterium]|nr:DUF3810 domain-containing protein [Thermoanaerobacteraceae bacterium]
MESLIFMVSASFPNITENIYSSFIYKIVGQNLGQLTSLFPFSLAEIAIVFSVIFTIIYTFRFGISFVKSKEIKELKSFFLI